MTASSLNNKATNTAFILVSEHGIRGAIIDLTDDNVELLPEAEKGSLLPSDLASEIIGYMREHAIGDIDIYVPVLPGLMSDDNVTALSRMLKMRRRDVMVMPVSDLLAYGVWDRHGKALDDAKERRAWALNSRMIMMFMDGKRALLSMVDSGRIISRLSLDDDLYKPFDSRNDSPAERIMHGVSLSRIDSWVRRVFSPVSVFYYMTGSEPDTAFSQTHETIRSSDIMDDLAQAAKSLDLSKSGLPDFISGGRDDFDDLIISLPDEHGREHSYPIFQHE